jgi:hypothetical protein
VASTNLSKTTDEDLLRLTSRKAEGFGVFCDRFERDVLAFFWRRTRRADLAADLTAEVIETAISIPAAVSSKGAARLCRCKHRCRPQLNAIRSLMSSARAVG